MSYGVMTGKELTGFCVALCDAIRIGADSFRFLGGVYHVDMATKLADEWIRRSKEKGEG